MASTAADNGTSAALVPLNATSQLSYSGTPRGPDGSSYPDDYAPKMQQPVSRMQTFEEMGQADDSVRTALEARRQEISAANWQLSTASTDPTAVEILEFVEDNIYPLLDQLLRQMSGSLQYGFAAIEPVYQWSATPLIASVTRGKINRVAKSGTGDRIWLRKLAHIRQTGVETFKIAGPNDAGYLAGDLISIKQHVFDGASFRQREVPASKVLLWTYDKQGDDYWGVPPTRHCFKAWSYKTQLEKISLMHFDKFGVGVPVLEEGEGWQQADRDRAMTMLMNWRSGARNALTYPKGGALTVQTAEGTLSGEMLDYIKLYALAIAKTMLTQMTELGSTDTGTRALGETFADQLSGIVQGDVEDLANLINNGLIVPLVRWNYGDQEFYPTFAPSQRVRAGSTIAAVLNQLKTAGVLHPRPEDEEWARDAYELPTVDLNTLKSEQDDRDEQASAIADAAGGPSSAAGGPTNAKPPVRIAASHDRRPSHALTAQMADGAPAPAVPYQTTWRTDEYSAWEHGILRPDVLSRELDMQTTRTASEVQDVLRTIDEDLARQVESLASKGAAALSAGIKGIAVPDRLRKQLRSVLLGAAQRARDYGAQAVANEIERQTGLGAVGPARTPSSFVAERKRLRALAATDETPNDLHLLAEVDRAVEDEIDRREGSARAAARDALASAIGATVEILSQLATSAAKESLTGLSPYRTEDNVRGAVNVGFGIGRSETAQDVASGGAGNAGSGVKDSAGQPIGITTKVYSAVMDLGTCDQCARFDGAEFPIDYPEDYTGVQAPNPRCAGTIARCRCVFVYVTDQEAAPITPASKGPQPIRRAA